MKNIKRNYWKKKVRPSIVMSLYFFLVTCRSAALLPELRLFLTKHVSLLDNYRYQIIVTEDMGGTEVWIERTLSFDGDLDDALSFDAPSCCVDISF